MMYGINQIMEQVPKKRRKYNRKFLNDYEMRLVVSRKLSNEWKHDFPNHQRKLNLSLNIRHEENTKTIDYFLVDNKPEPWDDSEPSAIVPENNWL